MNVVVGDADVQIEEGLEKILGLRMKYLDQRKNAAYHFLNLAPFHVPIPAHCRLVGLPRQVQFMLSTRTRRPLVRLVSSKRNEI